MKPREIADLLNLSRQFVYYAGRQHPPRPNGRSKVQWDQVDWTLSDSILGHRHGVTRQAISRHRRLHNIPPASEMQRKKQLAKLREVADSQGGNLDDIPLSVLMRATEVKSVARMKRLIQIAGFEYRRLKNEHPLYKTLNWELPNADLQEIWNLPANCAAKYRHYHMIPLSRWDKRSDLSQDLEYQAAIKQEKHLASHGATP